MDQRRLKLFDPEFRSSQSHSYSSKKNTDDSHDSDARETATVTMTRVVGEARVAVSVADLLPLLADAWSSKRAWLNDFSSDRVIVSQDLYEVLIAYKRFRSDKAA